MIDENHFIILDEQLVGRARVPFHVEPLEPPRDAAGVACAVIPYNGGDYDVTAVEVRLQGFGLLDRVWLTEPARLDRDTGVMHLRVPIDLKHRAGTSLADPGPPRARKPKLQVVGVAEGIDNRSRFGFDGE